MKNIQQEPEENIAESITLLIREFNNYKGADKNVAVLQADIDKVNLSFFNRLAELRSLISIFSQAESIYVMLPHNL